MQGSLNRARTAFGVYDREKNGTLFRLGKTARIPCRSMYNTDIAELNLYFCL